MNHAFRSLALLTLIIAMMADVAMAQETPSGFILPGSSEPGIVLDIPFESLPEAPVFIGMARLRFPAGSAIVGGSLSGPRVFLIETGSFRVLLDDPATVWRGSSPARAEPHDRNADVMLEAADLLIVSGHPPFEVINAGDSPGTLIDIVVWPPITERVRPFVTEAGVIFEPLAIGDATQMPEGPAAMVMERVELSRETEAPYELGDGPHLLYIETGHLGIELISGAVNYSAGAANAPGTTAGRLRTLDQGDEALLTAGGAIMMQAGSMGVLRNLGRTVVELLMLRFDAA